MRLNLTLIISDCEVWIDVLVRDHGEVEMVSFHGVIWINSTEKLNELGGKKNTEKRIRSQQIVHKEYFDKAILFPS